ncbi:carboxypeptidase-like regulatory domain-containing protein [Hyalangium sp.]|uniref:carboxypeptidase-like regulatory domain-containing protein n=1 Tax=Hyalangium sp. TaxID=2028555 RepID=UPI002D70EDBC|nr:carboxypeptidase-like regulatory domain-containing protein [Hyalangium sp.]HYH96617.1 carboxypeptidase-like regulatory domain-containing protein [Hyalangium sp.]
MSRRAWGFAGAAVVAGVLGAVLGQGMQPEPTPGAQRPAGTTSRGWERPRGVPTPPPSGNLRIQGLVRDERGPVAGVRVSATRPMPGETISELPCPGALEDRDPDARVRRLPECLHAVSAQVMELVLARHGEAPVHAETVTAADGSFVLEGLPEGEFTLWALGERGAELRPQVAAGAEGVELELEEGVVLEGIVTDPAENPLHEVRVTLLDARYSRFFDTQSGKDGHFRVGPLPKGDYALVAEKEDWLPMFSPPYWVEKSGRVILYQPGRLVGRVLSNGAPVSGTEVRMKGREEGEQVTVTDEEGRFAFDGVRPHVYELTAQREGQYAFVRASLRPLELSSREVVLHLREGRQGEGTVRDDTGRPIEGARVSVRREAEYGQDWEAVTDADGHYQLGLLVLGTYATEVSAPRYHLQNERHLLTRDSEPMDVTLTRAFSVSGKLVDEDGLPVPGATLQLVSSSEGETVMGTDSQALSDESGHFVVDAPTAGTWSLSSEDERFLPARMPVQAPAENVRWVLRRGGGVAGSVTDAQGAPLERVWVSLWKSGEGWTLERSEATDEQGRFSLAGLGAGSYVLEASLRQEGVDRQESRPLALRDSEHAEVSLSLEAGWSFSGLAVDEAGQPLSEVRVSASPPSKTIPPWRRTRRSCGDDLPRVYTGRDGRFTLRHLTGDAYELWAHKEDYNFVPAMSAGAEPMNESNLLVRPGAKEVRLVFKSQARVRGRLVGPEGAPLPRFEVNGRLVSDARGAFSAPIWETGTQEFSFEAPGMARATRSVEVQAEVDLDLGEVRMDPGRRVEGRVLDAETGAPVAGASLQVFDVSPDGPELSQRVGLDAETQEDGTFELPHLEARPFELEATRSGYRPARAALGSSNASVTVRLDPGAWVEVSVRDSQGRPLTAQVRFAREEDDSGENLLVYKGSGVQRGLEPGAYRVQVHDAGEARGLFLAQRVNIPERGKVTLAFVERREGATLALRVEGQEELILATLLPGTLSIPVTMEKFSQWGDNGLAPKEDKDVMTFLYLPEGRARLLLVTGGEQARFHLEELDVPAEGVLERVVRPRWQPLPDK